MKGNSQEYYFGARYVLNKHSREIKEIPEDQWEEKYEKLDSSLTKEEVTDLLLFFILNQLKGDFTSKGVFAQEIKLHLK